MAPKFKGDSEDWLDEKDSAGARKKKKGSPQKKAEALAPEAANGTVAEIFPKMCRVLLDDGRSILCGYRRASVLGHSRESVDDGMRERSPVAVGDRVLAQTTSPQDGVIEGVASRSNALMRPAPDRYEKAVHVLVANVDALVIVAAAKSPDFSPGIVDRFLVAAGKAGIGPVIAVNKMDLIEGGPPHPWQMYRDLGYGVFEVSAKQGSEVEALRASLLNRSVVFCGHSGVGKTSLLRTLLGSEIGKIGEVSELTGKGRHTTTGAVLLGGPERSRWIDTPGVRELGLMVTVEELKDYFPELNRCACDAQGCLHAGESGCKARDLARYGSYARILESLQAGEH